MVALLLPHSALHCEGNSTIITEECWLLTSHLLRIARLTVSNIYWLVSGLHFTLFCVFTSATTYWPQMLQFWHRYWKEALQSSKRAERDDLLCKEPCALENSKLFKSHSTPFWFCFFVNSYSGAWAGGKQFARSNVQILPCSHFLFGLFGFYLVSL